MNELLKKLPPEIINHILSFRSTHKIAKLFEPLIKEWKEYFVIEFTDCFDMLCIDNIIFTFPEYYQEKLDMAIHISLDEYLLEIHLSYYN